MARIMEVTRTTPAGRGRMVVATGRVWEDCAVFTTRLVARLHVDLQRVVSAACRTF
jgi:hypothetical protein